MDRSSVIGLILGFIAIGVGMVVKGVSLTALANPAAILIIIFGTIATVLIACPESDIKRTPELFKVIFLNKKSTDLVELVRTFSDWAQLARKEGLLALESKVSEIDNDFLKSGMTLAVDGQSADYIRDVLSEEISAMEDRHNSGAAIFTQAGTYAPTLGVLGAVVGLIAALANMSDIDLLGKAISAAFVATLLGIFTGYVLWHPFANKLKMKSKQEVKSKYMMIEGILSILAGESPASIEQKLSSFLTSQERKQINNNKGSDKDE
jgi:chemotaxis protein MotA